MQQRNVELENYFAVLENEKHEQGSSLLRAFRFEEDPLSLFYPWDTFNFPTPTDIIGLRVDCDIIGRIYASSGLIVALFDLLAWLLKDCQATTVSLNLPVLPTMTQRR